MFTLAHKQQLNDSGYCIIEGVLDQAEVAEVRARLVKAAAESERRGIPTYIKGLDPDDRNVRVFNLLDLDPIFIELISHSLALEIADHLLSGDFIVSNFTANTAKPGSRSMVIHSDLAVVCQNPGMRPGA